MDGKKTIAIILLMHQQQLPMHSKLAFWLDSFHVTAKNTTKNIAPLIRRGNISPSCVDVASPVKTQTLHYTEQYLKKISNFSSNINEVIGAVLNPLFCFFTKRFRTHQKHQKHQKHKDATKQKHKT